MPTSSKLKPLIVLSALTGALAVVSALGGLFLGLYTHLPQNLQAGSYGQDLSVLLAVALLALSVRAAGRGSAAGVILWLGVLALLFYSYAVYAFGGVYTTFYLAYIALVGLSAYALVGLAFQLDPKALAVRVGGRPPWPVLGALFLLVVVALVPRWLGEVLPLLGQTTYSPFTPVFVLDLGLVFPAFVLATVWLGQKRPWGRILAGILLVKMAGIGLNIFLGDLYLLATGAAANLGEMVFFGGFGLVAIVLGVLFFRPPKER